MIFQGDLSKLEIAVLKRDHPHSNEYWDGNWLTSKVIITVSEFKAAYTTCLRAEELHQLAIDMVALQRAKMDEVSFVSMEEELSFKVKPGARGKIIFCGVGSKGANELHFYFESDLAALDTAVKELKLVTSLYPVIGE